MTRNKVSGVIIVITAMFIVFWLYKDILQAHFNMEDAMFLGTSAKVLTKGNLKYLFLPWHGNYARFFRQPVSVFLYWFFGYNATPYFALSLLFHLTNVILIYILTIRLTGSKIIAFFSSLLYGISQVNLECLIWISAGNKDLPMTTFFLASLILFDQYLVKKKPKYLNLSYLFFFLCFSCEFKAVTVPLVFVLWEIIKDNKKQFKDKLKLKYLKKYFVYLFIEVFWILTFYRGTISIFSGAKNINFWQTYFASLPFYFLPTNRVFWIKIYTNAWALTRGQTDELYLKEFGLVIILFILCSSVYLWKRNKTDKTKKLIFLLVSVLVIYLPVVLMVLSKFYSLWEIVAVHWRYFTLASSLASILVVSIIFWVTREILDNLKELFPKLKALISFLLKTQIIPITILIIISIFHFEYNRFMLNDFFLEWSLTAKNVFSQIKEKIPLFPKESVLCIEGVEDELRRPFFDYRYLFENIFAMYAQPNNPNYQKEVQSLNFDTKEMFMRRLDRLTYYTNLKDFLVGNYWHIYQKGSEITWMSLNLPLPLPAFDRLLLGSIYGFYDVDKIYVLKIGEDGLVTDLTFQRRREISSFLNYFCFKEGQKECLGKNTKTIINVLAEDSFSRLSNQTKKVIDNLLNTKGNQLPDLYGLKFN
jgi:hypothetical protein